MGTVLIAAAAGTAGFFAGVLRDRRVIRRQRKIIRTLRTGGKIQKVETTKIVLWTCLAMGFLWVWCSYILAWMDKVQIAESLSSTAVTEIIGVVLAYCIKSAVENLSKNNTWPDKAKHTDETRGPQAEREEPPDVGV